MEAQAGLNPAQAPVEVLVDLCVKENTLDETLSYLLKKAKKRGSEGGRKKDGDQGVT